MESRAAEEITQVRVMRWDALKPADADVDLGYSVGHSLERTQLVRDLRHLADFIATHPEMPISRFGEIYFSVFADGTDAERRAQVDYASTLLGVPATDRTPVGGFYQTGRTFGRARYELTALPDESREPEPMSFAPGQDVRFIRQVARAFRGAGISQVGVVTSVENDGTYQIRLPGRISMNLPARTLEPLSFAPVTTSRGQVKDLAAAEAALGEATARIRAMNDQDLPPERGDVADQGALSSALSRVCGLPEDVLIHQSSAAAGRQGLAGLRAEGTARRGSPARETARNGNSLGTSSSRSRR
jgi:hypothetical protein